MRTPEEYFEGTMDMTEPRKTVMLAHKYFQMENVNTGRAVDLGAGTGRDTLFLLRSGWKVCALDEKQQSIDIILDRVEPEHKAGLEVQVTNFSNMTLPKEVDLINASFSLPFCKPEHFEHCWKTIVQSLAIGGRFCGHFFGEHDEWASDPELTIHSLEGIKDLFKPQFKIEYLQIEQGLIPNFDGQMKQWHIYHVVAKKQT